MCITVTFREKMKRMMSFRDGIFLMIFQILIIIKDTIALQMIGVSIPQYTMRGEMALLQCKYDLGQDRLYSVTWYKDHEEFYRYVPGRKPPQHVYKLDGFRVNHHRSDTQQVLLHSINLKARGVYRCEVSAEAPSFTSVHGEGRMDVVSLPQEGPFILGEEKNYKIGDIVNLNCTSGKSYPPAKLRWYINNYQVPSDYEAILQQPPHELMVTVAGLRFQVGPKHFTKTGRIQVRCVATISLIRDTVVQQRISPPLVDNREALILVEGASNHIQPNKCLIISIILLTIIQYSVLTSCIFANLYLFIVNIKNNLKHCVLKNIYRLYS